jgi:hypothetical protein
VYERFWGIDAPNFPFVSILFTSSRANSSFSSSPRSSNSSSKLISSFVLLEFISFLSSNDDIAPYARTAKRVASRIDADDSFFVVPTTLSYPPERTSSRAVTKSRACIASTSPCWLVYICLFTFTRVLGTIVVSDDVESSATGCVPYDAITFFNCGDKDIGAFCI